MRRIAVVGLLTVLVGLIAGCSGEIQFPELLVRSAEIRESSGYRFVRLEIENISEYVHCNIEVRVLLYSPDRKIIGGVSLTRKNISPKSKAVLTKIIDDELAQFVQIIALSSQRCQLD